MESSAPTAPLPRPTGFERSRRDVTDLLQDDQFDQPTCLLRLQGWRGPELDEAVSAGNAHRLAPGFCAIGATIVTVTGSWGLALALMVTATVGLFARNHPVEAIYNRLAPSIGRAPIPRNRAAKRLGCLLGTLFLGGSGLALILEASLVGRGLATAFAIVAWFVTLTNFCVPSAVFVALFGTERSTARKLI